LKNIANFIDQLSWQRPAMNQRADYIELWFGPWLIGPGKGWQIESFTIQERLFQVLRQEGDIPSFSQPLLVRFDRQLEFANKAAAQHGGWLQARSIAVLLASGENQSLPIY
jgi:hypothetical protein